MPSIPMLMTPTRSDHKAARPASRIGTVSRNAAPMVPDDVRLSKPVHMRVSDSRLSRTRA